MKVLISAPSFDTVRNVSGISASVQNIITSLGKYIEFIHLVVGSSDRKENVFTGVFTALNAAISLLRLDYDVLHLNTALDSKAILRDTALAAVAKVRGRKVVTHFHGGRYLSEIPGRLLQAAVRTIVFLSDSCIVLSNHEKTMFRAFYGRSLDLDVIPNGLIRSEIERRASSCLSKVRFLYVGRLDAAKGVGIFAEAIALLPVQDGVTFTFFGNGSMRSTLEALAAGRSDVHVHQPYSSLQRDEVFRSFDVLVLPSYFEGMPMAVVEAMTYGLMPICTAVGSIPEIVVDGETGRLVSPGSVAELKNALLEAIEQPAERVRMAESASDYAGIHLDASKNYLALLALYKAENE